MDVRSRIFAALGGALALMGLAAFAPQPAPDALVRQITATVSAANFDFRRTTAIVYRPLRAGAQDTEVRVRAEVRQPGTEPISIDYDLARSASGWKVFDVSVAGVSLAATYRTAFAEEVRERGIDGLIAALSNRNREAAKRAPLRT